MTITNNVAISNIFKVAHKITDNFPAALLDNNGPTPFNPANISGLRSRLLDAATFTSPISSKYYLRDTTVENTHLPRQGRCWLFDGVNDRARIGNSIFTSQAMTMCGWVRTPSLLTGFKYFAASGNDIFSILLARQISGNTIVAALTTDAGTFVADSGIVLPVNTNTHVATVWDGSVLSIYTDGQLRSQTNTTGSIVHQPWFTVGCLDTNNNIPSGITFTVGRMWDIRCFDVAKAAHQVQSIFNGQDDTVGLLAQYPCNEESGTVGYDISGNGNHLTLINITQSTFHAVDTGVTANRNNAEGYRLSGSVYIPKRLSDSLAADGNALTVTGRAAYHGCAETPCVTGNASDVYANLGGLLAGASDCSLSFWANIPAASSQTLISTSGNQTTNGFVVYSASTSTLKLWSYPGITVSGAVSFTAGAWNFIEVTRVGSSATLRVNGVASTPMTISGVLTGVVQLFRNLTAQYSGASIADLRITTGGVTTYFPLQDGPGSSNTNRDIAWVKSDGTGGVISNAIVNGTVSTIWVNRVPGNVEDWCVKYGGRIAANGAFVPGMLSGGNAADGSAKTLAAGKFGNPFSRLNLNPATAAELNGRSVPTAATVSTNINTTITPSNSAFERTKTDGDDRILIYDSALTGSDLTNVQEYIA